ncbi:hypothetical protein CR513_05770, partial [Mucuna pruriens]
MLLFMKLSHSLSTLHLNGELSRSRACHRDLQVQEVTLKNVTKKTHNEAREENRYYGKQYQRHEKPTLSFITTIDVIKTPTSV